MNDYDVRILEQAHDRDVMETAIKAHVALGFKVVGLSTCIASNGSVIYSVLVERPASVPVVKPWWSW